MLDGKALDTEDQELALIGSILLNNSTYFDVCDEVSARDFGVRLYSDIYAEIESRLAKGDAVDPLSLKPWIETQDEGDFALLVASTTYASKSGAIDRAKFIRTTATRRKACQAASEIIERMGEYQSDDTPETLIAACEGSLGNMQAQKMTALRAVATMGNDLLEHYRAVSRSNGKLIGIPTGVSNLDRMLGGLKKKKTYVLAARPSMGKSTLAFNIAESAAAHKFKVLIFSLEMGANEIGMKLMAKWTGIGTDVQENGPLTENDLRRLGDASERLLSLPITIDERGGVGLAHVQLVARRLSRRHGIDLVIIDHLNIMGGPSDKKTASNKVQEVSEITNGLKALAKELDIPVLELCQLSRSVESRENKRPMLSDLRDSGSIEQDADVVMFLYRHDYYLERDEPTEGTPAHSTWKAELAECKGLAELNIPKNRGGKVGRVNLVFDGQKSSFYGAQE